MGVPVCDRERKRDRDRERKREADRQTEREVLVSRSLTIIIGKI